MLWNLWDVLLSERHSSHRAESQRESWAGESKPTPADSWECSAAEGSPWNTQCLSTDGEVRACCSKTVRQNVTGKKVVYQPKVTRVTVRQVQVITAPTAIIKQECLRRWCCCDLKSLWVQCVYIDSSFTSVSRWVFSVNDSFKVGFLWGSVRVVTNRRLLPPVWSMTI